MTAGPLHRAEGVPHSDGSLRFTRPGDDDRQAATAALIEAAWSCTLINAGGLSFIDYLAVRDDRPIGWVEVIQRDYPLAWLRAHGGVWLKRKTYLTLLHLAEVPLSVNWRGGQVVWHLTDGLWHADVRDIDPRPVCADDPRGAPNDQREPVVLVTALRPVTP